MPRQYFFWKYLNTIIVLYCIIVQKNPIFVQLSPIQCTYSNIFIRFFKFFPANTNIYQNSYRVIGANCAVEIALSGRQCSLLCLFAPFSPRRMLHSWLDNRRKRQMSVLRSHTPFPNGYKSIPRGPRFSARNDKVLRTERNRFKNDQSVYVEFKTNRINIIQY